MFALALAALSGAADPATVRSAPRDDAIVVEGQRRPTQKEALRTVTDLTMIVESQIARFHDPVCPMVLGMERSAAAVVENRIRTTAKEVGASVSDGKCDANLIVFVTSDGPGLIGDLQKRRPRWFENVPAAEVRRALRDEPVRGWSATSVRNDKGESASGSAVTDADSFKGFVSSNSNWKAPVLRVSEASILHNASRHHIDGSVIIVDADAIEGFTLRQLGDYAAMRGLAKVRLPEDPRKLGSILSMFDRPRDVAPRELTAFDRNYLRGLYQHLDHKGFESSVFERQRLAKGISEEN